MNQTERVHELQLARNVRFRLPQLAQDLPSTADRVAPLCQPDVRQLPRRN